MTSTMDFIPYMNSSFTTSPADRYNLYYDMANTRISSSPSFEWRQRVQDSMEAMKVSEAISKFAPILQWWESTPYSNMSVEQLNALDQVVIGSMDPESVTLGQMAEFIDIMKKLS